MAMADLVLLCNISNVMRNTQQSNKSMVLEYGGVLIHIIKYVMLYMIYIGVFMFTCILGFKSNLEESNFDGTIT